ncbi:MAG: hypothetical protein AAF639_03260 [Chloroflexota bacterium]
MTAESNKPEETHPEPTDTNVFEATIIETTPLHTPLHTPTARPHATPPVEPTSPFGIRDRVLQEKYAESVANQCDQMDKLAQQLIVLQLGVFGAYASVLQLTSGEGHPPLFNIFFVLAFASWLVSLLLTLWSLMPVGWKVNPDILKSDPQQPYKRGNPLSIEQFFSMSARHKRHLLIGACVSFWLGILFAALVYYQ